MAGDADFCCKMEENEKVPSPMMNQISEFHRDKQWSYTVPPELENLPDFEKMMMIRARKRQNSETARKFFGSDLKIDVSLSAIEKYKLPAMLESDLPLAHFICYLLKFHGVENLFFLQAVQRFSERAYTCTQERVNAAQGIFEHFIEDDKPMQVNTTSDIKANLRSSLKTAPSGIFKDAINDSYGLLIQLYERFLQSEQYTLMRQELQANSFPESYRLKKEPAREGPCLDAANSSIAYCGSIYPIAAYQSAVHHIQAALKSNEKRFDDGFISRKESKIREKQINQMVQSFLNERLLMEFEDTQRCSMLSEAS